jgi:hypothetical protein
MIPELNQPARIASLECGKFLVLPEVFASNLGAACMGDFTIIVAGQSLAKIHVLPM